MQPDNPIYLAVKWLSFISPVIIIFLCLYFLFHSIVISAIGTIILTGIGVACLTYYVYKSQGYNKEILKALRKYK